MIYPPEHYECYSMAEDEVWLPAVCDTFEAAVLAFEVDDAQLASLQAAANARVGGTGGNLTLADLQAVVGEHGDD